MATKVYKEETLSLQDDTEVVIRPYNIKRMREFMRRFREIGNLQSKLATEEDMEKQNEIEDKIVDNMVDMAWSAIEQSNKGLANERGREDIEAVLDSSTMDRIISIAGGIDLEDPNPKRAAQTGTN